MNSIYFSELYVEGFGSIRNPLTFNLSRKGIYLLKGANGAGKTTVLSALAWCLYKVNLKNSSLAATATREEYRTSDWKGTKVSVIFNTDDRFYKVVRHIKYKGQTHGVKGGDSLLLFSRYSNEDWQEVSTEQHKGDLQAYIDRLLGVDSKAFLNSVLFGQRMDRLVKSKNEDKRRIFEQLFDLEFLEQMKLNAQQRQSKLREDISKKENYINRLLSEVAGLQNSNTQLLAVHEMSLIRKEELIQSYENEIKRLGAHIDKLTLAKEEQGEVIDYTERKEEIRKLMTDTLFNISSLGVSEINTEYEEVKEKRNKLISDVETARLTSKSAFVELDSVKRKLSEYSTYLDRIDSYITDYETKVAKSLAFIDSLEEEKNNVNTHCTYCHNPLTEEQIDKVKNEVQKNIDKENEVIKGMELEISKLHADLQKGEAEEVVLKQQVIDAERKYADSEEAYELLRRDEHTYDVVYQEANKKWVAVQEENTGLNKLLKVYEQELSDIKVYEDSIANIKDKISAMDSEIENTILEIGRINKNLQEKRDEVIEPPAAIAENKAKEEELQIDVLSSQANVQALQEESEKVSWWIDNAFSAKGVKAYVFNAMLNRLNEYAEKYAQRLGARVKFSVDLTKASTPFTTECYVNEVSSSYDDLSGGEQQRIDICLAFAMYDLVGHKINTNILVLDEVFEGLDADGIEAAFSIIRAKADEGKSIYVITHSATIDSLQCKTITVTKENNNTIILD